MADGEVKIGVGLSIGKAEKDLEKLKAKINHLEDDINEKKQKRSGIEERLNQARTEAEKTEKEIQRLNGLISEGESLLSQDYKGKVSSDDYNRVAGAVQNLKNELAEQEKLQKTQQKNIENISKEYSKADGEIEKGTKSLNAMKEQAGDMEKAIAASRPGEQLSKSIDMARGSLKKFLKYAIGIRSAFILFRRLKSAITDSVRAFAEYDDETKNNIQALKDSLQALKLSWGSAFAPIFNIVAPLLQKFIGWLTNAANAIARFIAILSGKSSYKRAIVNNENMADSLNNVAESAAEAKAQLMGFDELNVLNAPDTGSNNGSSTSPNAVEMVEEPIEAGSFIERIKDNLEGIELLGFNSLLGIGLALLLTGANVPLGLGLVAVGAIGLAREIAPRWDEIKDKIGGSLSAIVLIVSGLMLGIGAVLAFSGANIPLGIGLMAAGMLGAANVAAINWNLLPANVQTAIAKIDFALGVSTLAIGALLAFTGVNIPLGIGMMLAGGALIGAGVAVEWNALPDEIKKALGYAEDEAGQTGGVLNNSIIKSIQDTDFAAIHNVLQYKIDRDIFGEKWAKFVWSKGEYAGKDIVMSMINGTNTEMPTATAEMSESGQELGESYEKGVSAWAATAENSLAAKAFGWITKKVKELFKIGEGKSEFEEIGEESGAGMEKGLDAWKATSQDSLIARVFGGFIDGVKRKLGIASPSTVFESIGRDLDAGLENGVKNNWAGIPSFFQTSIDAIKRMMNFSWSFPKPKMPHFSVTWQDLGGIISIPHISVQWYAKGGIFDTASLIGVGEAGKEAVVPLERNTEWINLVANSIMDRMAASDFTNRLAEAFVSVPRPSIARGAVVPPNAFSGTFGGDWSSNILQEISALRREISALSQRPIEVDTTLELDRRVLGKAVTRYQAGAERAYG